MENSQYIHPEKSVVDCLWLLPSSRQQDHFSQLPFDSPAEVVHDPQAAVDHRSVCWFLSACPEFKTGDEKTAVQPEFCLFQNLSQRKLQIFSPAILCIKIFHLEILNDILKIKVDTGYQHRETPQSMAFINTARNSSKEFQLQS